MHRYLGEWYEPPSAQEGDHKSTLAEQQSAAKASCWTVAAIYGGFAIVSGVGMGYHAFKSRR